MSRLKKGSAIAAMAVAIVGGFEGLRLTAYPDPATGSKPWTICYGHTAGVKPGDRHTLAECKALLVSDLSKYANGIQSYDANGRINGGCVKAALPDARFVALTSFAYNVGVGAACKSSVVRLINEGKVQQGCDALLKWNKAAGVVFPGLTKRRQKERALCLEGLK